MADGGRLIGVGFYHRLEYQIAGCYCYIHYSCNVRGLFIWYDGIALFVYRIGLCGFVASAPRLLLLPTQSKKISQEAHLEY